MPERILLVQIADIGDLITITPAVAALRRVHPDVHLTLLAASGAADIIEPSLVDDIITVDRRSFNSTLALLNPAALRQILSLRQHHFDAVIFFQHLTLRLGTLKYWLIARASGAPVRVGLDNGNGWFLTHPVLDEGYGARHQVEYAMALVGQLGADNEAGRTRVAMSDDVLPLPARHRGLRIVIHAGGGTYSLARRWSPAAFAQVADALSEQHDAEIVLVGTETDDADEVAANMERPAVNLTGKTTLTQLADLIRSAHLFIGTDGGVMNIASATNTPIVALFGPSNADAWRPWSPGNKAIVLRSLPRCSPCLYVGHEIGARQGCPPRTCMRMIEPEHVISAANKLLDGEPAPPYVPYQHPERDWTDTLQMLGMPVDRITYKDWMRLIDKWVKEGERLHHVCTTNPEFIVIAQRDKVFSTVLRRADLCVPDGVGLLLGARILGAKLPERVTGSDGTIEIARHAAENGWKLFLLGAAEGVADTAAQRLVDEFPGLEIVGVYSGSPAADEEEEIVRMVNWSGADVLLVAYGAPEQDKWIARNSPRLQVKMAMGVGGAFDFIAGIVPRAPEWMQQYGLEWLYRLYKQPWRIRRMLRLPVFVLLVLLRGEK